MSEPDKQGEPFSVIIAEAQLVLAEKRTSLATLRTGIALTALPLGVASFLLAFSRGHEILALGWLLTPVLVVCVGLLGLGVTLIVRATRRVLRADHLMQRLKQQSRFVRELED